MIFLFILEIKVRLLPFHLNFLQFPSPTSKTYFFRLHNDCTVIVSLRRKGGNTNFASTCTHTRRKRSNVIITPRIRQVLRGPHEEKLHSLARNNYKRRAENRPSPTETIFPSRPRLNESDDNRSGCSVL